jgi:outer membrane receptor protein involved in Fe transport
MLGLRQPLTPYLSVNCNLSQGFRAPNLSDISKLGESKGNIYEVPNPDLDPERMLSIDLGFKWKHDIIQGSLYLYQAELTDMLLSANTTYNGAETLEQNGILYKIKTKKNMGEGFIRGLEAAISVQLTGILTFFSNVTTTYGQNKTFTEPIGGIPPTFGLAGFQIRIGERFAVLSMRFASKQNRLSADDRDDPRIPEGGTPGWCTMKFRTGFPVFSKLFLQFSMENILDINYREHGSGINGPGRNAIVSLSIGL